MLAATIAGNFPRPRAVKPGIPRPLEAICLKALAADPENRYGSAIALGDDVEHWLADEPVAAYAESNQSNRKIRRMRISRLSDRNSGAYPLHPE